jgi:hypothetical protein
MPALLLSLVRGIVAIWEFLVELMPSLGRILPWLLAFLPAITTWLKNVSAYIAAQIATQGVRGAVSITCQAACIWAWGVFLAVLFTGINGFAIRQIVMTNPFSGFPEAMMFLVVSCFPVKFCFALAQAYLVWKFTYVHAAYIMSRTVRLLFGV